MKIIESDRLILKNYAAADKESLIALLTDEAVMRFVDLGVFTIEKAEKLWTKLIEEMYLQGKNTIYAVFAKDDGRYIGYAAIRPRPAKLEDWEISYVLKTEEWGKGFATEIARRLIDFGFEDLGLDEVYATIDDENFSSMKVVEKAGMNCLGYEFDEQGRFSVYSIKKFYTEPQFPSDTINNKMP